MAAPISVLPTGSRKEVESDQESSVMAQNCDSRAMSAKYSSEFLPLSPHAIGRTEAGGNMPLSKEYVRDGKRRIIGSVTTGFTGAFDTIVRDESGDFLGRTSEKFQTIRDSKGKLDSINSADPGLLIGKRK
jgi:hypothetical protein